MHDTRIQAFRVSDIPYNVEDTPCAFVFNWRGGDTQSMRCVYSPAPGIAEENMAQALACHDVYSPDK